MKRRRMTAVVGAILFGMWMVLEGCKDMGNPFTPPTTNPPPSGGSSDSVRFSTVVHPILLANCAISGCHHPPAPTANFDQTTYAGVRAGGATFGPNVIHPGDSSYSSASTSVGSGIMKMLRNTNNPYGNFRMPQGGQYVSTGLPDSMIVQIGTWIMQGAKNN